MWYEEILTIISGWSIADIQENAYVNVQKKQLPILDKAMDIIWRSEALREVEKDFYIEIAANLQEKNKALELENKQLKEFISKNSGAIFPKGNEVKGITKKLTTEEVNALLLLK